ncbi:MAG TPA: cytochrome C biogenesis protein, partial [Opitutus sp.]|nr:cytochrome C biogenesis protein [Opitutus sp.]
MTRFLPLLVLLAALASVVASLRPLRNHGPFDLVAFGQLPVVVNGRVKPLDTVARTSLLVLQGRQRVSDPAASTPFVHSPAEWLADVLFHPAKADTYPTFRISASDSPDLLTLMGLTEEHTKVQHQSAIMRALAVADFVPSTRSRFSYQQLEPRLGELDRQAKLADAVEPQLRNGFQKAVVQLRDRLVLYQRLKHSLVPPASDDFLGELARFQDNLAAGVAAVRAKQAGEAHDEKIAETTVALANHFVTMAQTGYLLAVPPAAGEHHENEWKNAGTVLLETFESGRVSPFVLTYAGLARTWRSN